MTDKQIIIDGVDVCRCRYYDDRYGYCDACRDDIDGNSYTKCMYEDDCYYKQLKAKEQEYEKLRQYHNKCCEEFEKEKKEWLEKYNQVSRDFYNGKYCNAEKCQQLDQLKAENEELKKKCNIYTCGICGNKEDCNKLYKTLTEIKEIAEICKCHNVDGCYECKYFDDCEVEDEEIPTRDVCKLILQKISEVEDEN